MDIAEVLRHQASDGNVFDQSNDTVVVTRPLLTQAADEIERLRGFLSGAGINLTTAGIVMDKLGAHDEAKMMNKAADDILAALGPCEQKGPER